MPSTTPELLPARIDHTCLRPTATAAEIERVCEEAVEWGFASVCVPPNFVPLAAERLYGSEVRVGTVIGFPCGYAATAAKRFEAQLAVQQGAAELDMVIPLGAALDGDLAHVAADVQAVVAAAPEAVVKVILECGYLHDALKRSLVEVVAAAGAAFVKTSTGFGPGGATIEDVRLLASTAAGRVRVKASGGIRDWTTCQAMLQAGADRIGTSSGVEIVRQWQQGGR